jgi:crossover junction endodeoxyribonuclease RusA
MMTLVMPWPGPDLSPNARIHWAVLARAKKAYRESCGWQAKAQGARPIKADRLDVAFTFYPPTKRRIDLDNCIARMKAGIDGIADVVGVDDSKWRMSFEIAPQVGGMVKVTIQEIYQLPVEKLSHSG